MDGSLNWTLKLSSGYECPIMGYGTFLAKDAGQLKTALTHAIKTGYRHIDTAHAYCNEEVIGETLQTLYDDGIIKRGDLFITTKLFPTQFRPDLIQPMLKSQLEKLKTSYVDLYLLHFPVPMKPPKEGDNFASGEKMVFDLETKLEDTWMELEKCVKLGLTRSVGVSNFSISQVKRLLICSTIKPAMNQVEIHPHFQNKKLVEFCQSRGVEIVAYSQFGRPGVVTPLTGKPMCEEKMLEDGALNAIGKKYNKTEAQVILRWLIQRNIAVIPKSVTPSRINDNFDVWNFSLSVEDMKTIEAIDRNKRYNFFPVPGIMEHPEYPFIADGSSC